MSAPLTIAVLADSADFLPLLGRYLDSDRYVIHYFTSRPEFLAHIETVKYELDCLIFSSRHQLAPAINYLYERGLILPVVLIRASAPNRLPIANESDEGDLLVSKSNYIYQPSEIILAATDIAKIGETIERSISKFLRLTPSASTADDVGVTEIESSVSEPNFLIEQQRRLAEKLKERLGYLAVYYKRNPQQFFRHLDREQKQELLQQLKSQYRQLVLDYFTNSSHNNDQIDEFVSSAFFTDLSVSEIVKIHMELMEEFSKQLKLEGRSEEILLDYRLTLIDIIAHLCEMYRRSIPREM